MSKNLTRKGLALSAVLALGTSLFAGAPAQAASGISIAPSAGTSWTVLASDSFTVKVVGSTSYAFTAENSTSTTLRWKVTKPSASATVTLTNQGVTTAVSRDADRTNPAIEYIAPGNVTATLGRNTLTLDPSVTSAADAVYKVQAYIETDGVTGFNSALETTASDEATITFSATAVPTLTLDQVGVDAVATGKVTYTPAINYDLTTLVNTFNVWTRNGTDVTATTAVARSTDGTYLKVDSTSAIGTNTIKAADVVSAVAKTVRYDGDTTYAVSASVSSSTNAATADSATATITKGADIALASGETTKYVVRAEVKTFAYSVKFKKGTAVVAAGQPVTIKVTPTGLADSAGDVVKVNGTTISNSAATSINTSTATGGTVAISVESNTGNAGDALQIEVTSNSKSTDNLFTWEKAAIAAGTSLKESSLPVVPDAGTYTRTITRGSAFSLSFALVDQFGQKWTSSNTATTYRLNVARGNVSGTATWSTVYADFAAGVATVSVTDNSTANTTYQISVSVDRRQNGTGDWLTGTVTEQVVKVTPVTALSTPSKITLGNALNESTLVSDTDGVATNTAKRSTETLARINRLVDVNTDSALAILDAHAVKITGVVKRADGGIVAGTPVTIAASGVYFGTDKTGTTYVSKDTITTVTDVTGQYTIYAYSNAGGTKSVSITAGVATATQKIKWEAALAKSGSAITITAPAYTAAGRSVDVTVLLTDEFGAPVQSTSASPLRVSVTGAGSFTTIAADSDADGLVSFKLIFGANETGVATIKATYDVENDATIDITKTATVTIGSAPATAVTAAVAGSTGKFYVSVTNAAAKKVVIKVAGKFVKSFTGTAAKKTVVTKATKGSKKVTVYVGGKLVATKTVTVK